MTWCVKVLLSSRFLPSNIHVSKPMWHWPWPKEPELQLRKYALLKSGVSWNNSVWTTHTHTQQDTHTRPLRVLICDCQFVNVWREERAVESWRCCMSMMCTWVSYPASCSLNNSHYYWEETAWLHDKQINTHIKCRFIPNFYFCQLWVSDQSVWSLTLLTY